MTMSFETSSLKSHLLPVVIIALGCAVILSVIYQSSKEPIANSRQQQKLARIDSVIPRPFDNDISNDVKTVTSPQYFGSETITVFRSRRDGMPAGVVFLPVPARGYSSAILLAVGIHDDGRIAGIHVLEHAETRGIGDAVDQTNSDWLQQFRGHSLDNTANWALRQNNGVFDQISGATITSRGVITAVQKALEYYNLNRDNLYK